ncbi:hypothetical protein TrST_g13056 [Triparma strigata]|uniref:BRCT domain-containing protein n=1 Tax=Triparma strigata TaxID=1606541 RepID=A0A9W7EPT5_9STRA|nr:hypothetical protein TrST_g13056 [Triparma strigata]
MLAAKKQSSGPLSGLTICLSGLTPSSKSLLRPLITSLGATYSKDLNVDLVTHLITNTEDSDKFRAAFRSKNEIHIVKEEWLNECVKTNKRVKEEHYGLDTLYGEEDIQDEQDEQDEQQDEQQDGGEEDGEGVEKDKGHGPQVR